MSSPQKLEAEDDESRQKRLARLLVRTDSSIARSEATRRDAPVMPIRNRQQLPPLPSGSNDLLNRIKQFLPELEAANQEIKQKMAENPKSVDIEELNSNEDRYIEMDLGLGIFKQRRTDGTLNSSEEEEDNSEESSTSGDSSEDPSDEEEEDKHGEDSKEAREIKPLPRRNKGKNSMIVELG